MARAYPTVNLEELDRLGFTVVRGLLPRTLTGALRQCMYLPTSIPHPASLPRDTTFLGSFNRFIASHRVSCLVPREVLVGAGTDRLLEERARHSKGGKVPGATQSLRNLALYGGEQVNVMASAIAESESLRVARQLSKCNEIRGEQQLQLIEQVLIRTDPSAAERHGPTNFHLDWIFLREHYDAVPRQTYFHMVTYLCDVAAGQAAFTILPGSHHQTYAAASHLCSYAELQLYTGKLGQSGGPFAELKKDPVKVAGLDPSTAVEVTGLEGDCVICEFVCFCPGACIGFRGVVLYSPSPSCSLFLPPTPPRPSHLAPLSGRS